MADRTVCKPSEDFDVFPYHNCADSLPKATLISNTEPYTSAIFETYSCHNAPLHLYLAPQTVENNYRKNFKPAFLLEIQSLQWK